MIKNTNSKANHNWETYFRGLEGFIAIRNINIHFSRIVATYFYCAFQIRSTKKAITITRNRLIFICGPRGA